MGEFEVTFLIDVGLDEQDWIAADGWYGELRKLGDGDGFLGEGSSLPKFKGYNGAMKRVQIVENGEFKDEYQVNS